MEDILLYGTIYLCGIFVGFVIELYMKSEK